MTFNIQPYVKPNIFILRTDDLTVPTLQKIVDQIQEMIVCLTEKEVHLLLDFQPAPLDFTGTLGAINFLNKVERKCQHQLNLYLIGHHTMMPTIQTMMVKNKLIEENRVFRIDNMGNALDVIRRKMMS